MTTGLNRRALFGAGLRRALEQRIADEPDVDPARPRPPLTAGEADALRLGPLLGPVAARMLARAAGRERLLVAAAGDGTPLAATAATAGHVVTALERDDALRNRGQAAHRSVEWRAAWPVGVEPFDAVLAWFGATYDPSPRALAQGLRRAARPDAPILVAAWTPEAMQLLLPEPSRGHRPEQWSRYETGYRHFFDMPGFDVETGAVDAGFDTPLRYALVVVDPSA